MNAERQSFESECANEIVTHKKNTIPCASSVAQQFSHSLSSLWRSSFHLFFFALFSRAREVFEQTLFRFYCEKSVKIHRRLHTRKLHVCNRQFSIVKRRKETNECLSK